jgi:hypothetical protein
VNEINRSDGRFISLGEKVDESSICSSNSNIYIKSGQIARRVLSKYGSGGEGLLWPGWVLDGPRNRIYVRIGARRPLKYGKERDGALEFRISIISWRSR